VASLAALAAALARLANIALNKQSATSKQQRRMAQRSLARGIV